MKVGNKLTLYIVIALIAGIAVGSIFNTMADAAWVQWIDQYIFNVLGQIFLNLIFMVVVPVVFISIVLGVVSVGDPKTLGLIGIKTMIFYLATTAIAISLAIGIALVLQPGEGQADLLNTEEVSEYRSTELEGGDTELAMETTFDQTLINIIPDNLFMAMAEQNMLQIIAFAIFIGVGLIAVKEKASGIIKLFEQANEVIMWIVLAIMKYFAALGAFGLVATAFTQAGFGAIQQLGMYFICVLLALFIHFAVVYGSVVQFLGKHSFVWFIKQFMPAMTVAFSTSSSSAVLPVSLETAQNKLGIRKSISSFVQPLGATVNMDGTAIMQGVATVFIAQLSGIDLTIGQMATVVIIATIASIGTAGVPGVGLVMLAMVLTAVGLDPAAIGIIIGIDRLLDMTRTSVNITGDATIALVIDHQQNVKEGKFIKGQSKYVEGEIVNK
ncbi:Proton glutamate symport protein [Jeotgalicoccus aerolatus]|uniref:Na+/H+-dicarboxylate symporter n=1 Tax=Jeotgalicoccus aerolatus TaxID=709510 RepID=A0A1G9CT44_9STAP|nr:dicarboxylate/amino acid:cation symporter [Jeotgalicoccus aerolatus]MBP1952671.1 Na+/H+-dicarboxylate symporter [Jeotgalicoccus aerolatus]NMA81607.1 dicarboxylate/amino acid:cation symporter [Jeotgalicoccus aerolatus]CAD2073980.1 Proton glutamate symport protein [Jeotgalicoccus aerolatus]SDK54840.1 Na+/H+-dicarboxylate symporter [Jeotgalicoccus aerolatus]GGD91801.1 sodium:dicarboxylate symporter [Jeotgalicoccus aerolatus]